MPDDRVPQLGEHPSRRLHGLCHAGHPGRGTFKHLHWTLGILTKVHNFVVWLKIKGMELKGMWNKRAMEM
jgi:hypothetical protein